MDIVRSACCTILAVWLALPFAGWAGNCSGTNFNSTTHWEEVEIGKGSKVATHRHTSTIRSDDTSAPYHMASGECVGAYLIGADGRMQGSGSCARADKDGDVLYEEWVMPSGTALEGTWRIVGGTGKFAKATGNARWEASLLGPKSAAVRWSGQCD
ncbi:MAG: hypothetical protein IT532_04915 [Burkholderiales bacterium]|nr:hypothetical protein [Burkholderiales bacterium]